MKSVGTILILLFLGLSSIAHALDIPLGGSVESSSGGTSVGYVDMDRIFQIYPKTAIAKEDYAKQLQKKREQLKEKEAQVANLRSRMGILESTLKDQGTEEQNATGTQRKDDMKQELETKILELEEMRKQAEKDLSDFQSQQSKLILGNIYKALKDLAQEEQVTLVVDKASILYGDNAIDLTDKLQRKVRGY